MDFVRSVFDWYYDKKKDDLFEKTGDDPKRAHEMFVTFSRRLCRTGLTRFILNNSSNKLQPPFELSNAAGFNKNGDIPPIFLKYLGFDRVVVGTVTYDQHAGNPRPSIARYPETESLVNWEGLPGVGAKAVARNISRYGNHGVPLTINLMATPGKKDLGILKDIQRTIWETRDLLNVDTYELNISCPNTHSVDGSRDSREENLTMLDRMLEVVGDHVHSNQQIYLKVSPDSTSADVDDTLGIVKNHRVDGIVTANTTTNHDRKYILFSPEVNGEQVGGASGNAVYHPSLRTQVLYNTKIEELGLDLKLIACGGINSLERVGERLKNGATGIQIYTPLVFSGPGLLREFRGYKG